MRFEVLAVGFDGAAVRLAGDWAAEAQQALRRARRFAVRDLVTVEWRPAADWDFNFSRAGDPWGCGRPPERSAGDGGATR